jgi:methylmalonyl-CoA/ethylmalonyl-CoA epimerase
VIKKIHHISIVVRDMEEAFLFYCDALGLPLHKMTILEDQGVKAALLPLGESEIELLEPIRPDTGIAGFLERRGEGLHHICFETDDIERELDGLNARDVQLIDEQARRGLAGQVCFVHPAAHHGVLVELAQPVE